MWIYKSNLTYKNFLQSGCECSQKYLRELNDEYIKLRNEEIPALTLDDFAEYRKTGKRLGYEKKYFLRRTMLRDFALKAWMSDSEAVKPLEKVIKAICAEPAWALPAHVGGGEPREVIDLFAAETAQSLTEIVSLLDGALNESVAERAIREVKSRVLMPFINRDKPYNWESMKSNWCAVCGGSVGMTAIYLTENDNELKQILKSLKGTFEGYMESFSEDGACLEGLYYWGYGMTYLISFLDLYRQRMVGEFPINTAKLTKMADFAHKCCVTDGITVSFSDGNERDGIYSGLSSALTEKYGAAPITEEYRAYLLGDDCGRWCRAVRDIAWTREYAATKPEKISLLPDAQWAVVRGENYSLAVKGGGNGEPHNHNDVGSLTAVKNGRVILCDLGAGEYTREYFSDSRYAIFCCSSYGHSVPIIDGKPQLAGAEYGAKSFKASGGGISADISGAYGIKELKTLTRSVTVTENGIEITDSIKTGKPLRITERFITRHGAAAAAEGADIIIDGERFALVKCGVSCEVTVKPYEHREHDGTIANVAAIDFDFEVNGDTKLTFDIY